MGPACLVVAFLSAFRSPALVTPYWQDDFGCLLQARDEAARGQSCFASFITPSHECFWRPMSIGLYWRLVGSLGASARVAHGANLLLLLASSAAVGRLAAMWLRLRFPELDAARGGVLAMLFYGLHNARFLPTVWACCVQDLLLVLFSALCLHGWLVAITADRRHGAFAAATVLPCAAAALLCKETAVVLPLLAAILTAWIHPKNGRMPRVWVLGGLLVAMTGVWWCIHQRMTAPPADAYRIQWDMGLVRNGTCLVLFLFNMPREAIRFMLAEHSATAAIWGVACFALAVAGCAILIRTVRNRIGRRDIFCFLAFIGAGFGPHLPLAWNCYEYYASIALVAVAFLVGTASRRSRATGWAMSLLILSSALAALGNYWLPYPSLLARARWGERQLTIVRSMQRDDPEAFKKPVYLRVEDEHKFQAFGSAGLAYALGLCEADFAIVPHGEKPPLSSPVLVIPACGDVHWESDAFLPAPSPPVAWHLIL